MRALRERSASEVLLAFLQLGLTSFGGPTAHLGYFRRELVQRRRWIDDAAYGDLVALCQFLPGPASSQVGFSLGLARAGYLGGLAAWAGFTLPSALLMTCFAAGFTSLQGPVGRAAIHGLKLVAVAIVAQALWGMARSLCPDARRAGIAAVATLIALASPSSAAQTGAILAGGIGGWWLCRQSVPAAAGAAGVPVSRRAGVAALAGFAALALLAVVPGLGRQVPGAAEFGAFYRCGALVFGGGHVVLPLLSDAFVTPGWVSADAFVAGYGAVQAVPGPLFTFAAYLGAVSRASPHGMGGAALGLIAIFLPGLLLLVGTLPFWAVLRRRAGAQAAMRGGNAAVVGLLAAALYHPLWTGSVGSVPDAGVALAGFALLVSGRAPTLLVVILGALLGIALR
jgi:chromate transporter